MDLFFNRKKKERKEPQDISFETLFLEHYKPLLAYAITLTGNRENAEDIIQEVFLQIWVRREEIDFIYIKAYLYKSVYHKFLSYQRDNKLYTDGESIDYIEKYCQQVTSYDLSDELHCKNILQEINRLVDSLPERGKEIFRMSREQKMSHKKIAADLNISEKAVEKHITKTLKGIREALRKAGYFLSVL